MARAFAPVFPWWRAQGHFQCRDVPAPTRIMNEPNADAVSALADLSIPLPDDHCIDCHDAEDALALLIRRAGITMTLRPHDRDPRKYSRAPIQFDATLAHEGREFSTPYSAGIGIAERAAGLAPRALGGKGLTIFEAEERAAAHAAYRPSLVDVVGSLLLDAASVEGCRDWLEWAEETGQENFNAVELRSMRTAFDACHDGRNWLTRVFLGEAHTDFGWYERAAELEQYR